MCFGHAHYLLLEQCALLKRMKSFRGGGGFYGRSEGSVYPWQQGGSQLCMGWSHWGEAADVLVEATSAKNRRWCPQPLFSPVFVFSQCGALIDSMYTLRKSFFTQESLRGFIRPETQQRNARERCKLASEPPQVGWGSSSAVMCLPRCVEVLAPTVTMSRFHSLSGLPFCNLWTNV